MEYVKGKPYFCDCKEKIKQYRYLDRDFHCDILIVGGGIDGAIANFYLAPNFDVALVDKGRIGFACTACATALLEYQLDDYAADLKKTKSIEEIKLAYKMGLEAIDKIDRFIKKHGNLCNYSKRPTFLFTNSIFQVGKIKEEYACFGTTQNNLGLIGASKIEEDILLFISCGANGIINAMKGIEIIEDLLQGKNNKLSSIFSPKREV